MVRKTIVVQQHLQALLRLPVGLHISGMELNVKDARHGIKMYPENAYSRQRLDGAGGFGTRGLKNPCCHDHCFIAEMACTGHGTCHHARPKKTGPVL